MDIRIIRSHKRVKTVQAREVDGILEIRAPAMMSDAELRPIIVRFRQRIERRKRTLQLEDNFLEERAKIINRRFFDGHLAWQSIRWSPNQVSRHGSCSPWQGDIRISTLLAAAPRFVLDYVIIHELAHLLEPNHGKRFWTLVNRYPKTERARGYLMAMARQEPDQDLEV